MLVGAALGVPFLLVGTKLSKVDLSASLDTVHLDFVNSADFHTGDIFGNDMSLSVYGVVMLPDGRTLTDERVTITLENQSTNDPTNATVAGFRVPAGTKVSISLDRSSHRLSIGLEGPEAIFDFSPTFGSQAEVYADSCEGRCIADEDSSTPITVKTNRSDITTIQMSQQPYAWEFANFVALQRIATWELDTEGTLVQKRSGIQSGTLKFFQTPELVHAIQSGELMEFVPRRLVMRSVVIEPTGIAVNISGAAKDVRTEIGTRSRSLKPNWFDALSRDPRVQLLAAFITITFGTFLSLFRSMRGLNNDEPNND